MGKKVESFQSNDGVLFGSEYEMLVHEATTSLVEEFPQLKMQIPFIMQNVDRIAAILHSIGSHTLPPEGSHTIVQSTRAEDGSHYISGWSEQEDRGGCDCSAGLAGNGGPHDPSCPMFRAEVRCRYAHPPGTRCPACASVPKGVTVIPALEAKARG